MTNKTSSVGENTEAKGSNERLESEKILETYSTLKSKLGKKRMSPHSLGSVFITDWDSSYLARLVDTIALDLIEISGFGRKRAERSISVPPEWNGINIVKALNVRGYTEQSLRDQLGPLGQVGVKQVPGIGGCDGPNFWASFSPNLGELRVPKVLIAEYEFHFNIDNEVRKITNLEIDLNYQGNIIPRQKENPNKYDHDVKCIPSGKYDLVFLRINDEKEGRGKAPDREGGYYVPQRIKYSLRGLLSKDSLVQIVLTTSQDVAQNVGYRKQKEIHPLEETNVRFEKILPESSAEKYISTIGKYLNVTPNIA